MNQGYQDQFNIPIHISNKNANVEFKIVPFGGSIKSPNRVNT